MTNGSGLLLSLDLAGTFAFSLNGGMTAIRLAKVDIVGVVALAMVSSLGGGILRDIILGSLPPATFNDWRYLAVAAGGGFIAFAVSGQLARLSTTITVLEAAGLGLFAVTGTSKAMSLGLGMASAIILGIVTAVGGGTLRDTFLQQVPTVFRSGLYAIPAACSAIITAVTVRAGIYAWPAALSAAFVCFHIRMLGVHYHLNAPLPRMSSRAHQRSGKSDHRSC